MAQDYGSSSRVEFSFGPKITSGVKTLIIINVAVFFLQIISSQLSTGSMSPFESLLAHNSDYIERGYIWQFFTYQFLHARDMNYILHIVFNMFALWMFGSELEAKWGRREFVKFYLICGLGAGVVIYILPKLLGQVSGTTIGASGAIFGLLLAYAIHWPDRKLLFMFIFPVKVKYFVLVLGIIELYFTLGSTAAGRVSHVGHLGGLFTAYFYILYLMNKTRKNGVVAIRPKLSLWQRFKNERQRKRWLAQNKQQWQAQNTKPAHADPGVGIHNEQAVSLQKKVDEILEKISQKGMKSLSAEEKNFLRLAAENLEESGSYYAQKSNEEPTKPRPPFH